MHLRYMVRSLVSRTRVCSNAMSSSVSGQPDRPAIVLVHGLLNSAGQIYPPFSIDEYERAYKDLSHSS